MRQRKRATAIDLRQTLNVLLAARKGDFSARLPPDYEGLAGKVADALNDVIGQNEALAAELQRLSTVVGKEGRTTHRAALPGAAGQWAASLLLVISTMICAMILSLPTSAKSKSFLAA